MQKNLALQSYYSRIHKRYDLVNRLFTFGFDRKWRRETVEFCLKDQPSRILDLCCGTGDLAITISEAARYPVRISALDMSREMLGAARQKAERRNNRQIEFIEGDAGHMPFQNGEFDCITIGFGFRNLTFDNPDHERHLREIARVMKDGARLLILESARPKSRFVAFFHKLYLNLILVPLGGLITGDWAAYRYLAKSSAGFYSFAELSIVLGKYGLILQPGKEYALGSASLVIATKK